MLVCFVAILILLTIPAASTLHSQENPLPTATTHNTIIRTRQGPGLAYSFAHQIAPDTTVTLLALSGDRQWVLSIEDNRYGWLPLNKLVAPSIDTLPILNTPPAPERPPEDRCISIVGDSVPAGEVVFLVPGHGFPVVKTRPISNVLQAVLNAHGLEHIEVRDRSVGASYLSEEGEIWYRETEAYAQLLNDRCRHIVIMPWVNDLIIVRDNRAEAHIEVLIRFVEDLIATSPDSHILVMGYYYGQPESFVPGYDTGSVSEENIESFNQALAAACASDGPLGSLPSVNCMPTRNLFDEMETNHVVKEHTQIEFYAVVDGELSPDVASFFEVYWRENPEGLVYGDGMHLSEPGKVVLVDALLDKILEVDPDL